MKKVLIIEDNPDNLTLIKDILEINGYKTIYAEEGQAGFELAEDQLPDFIILDIQLPDIDGYAVLKKIRDSEKTRHIPVIAMTSFAMAGDRERLLKAGCDGYVEKPINPVRVMEQIRDALGENK